MRAIIIAVFCVFSFFNVYASDVQAITDFNPNLYVGNWYEIARIPFYFEKNCIAPTIANYALDDDSLSVINTCKTKTGSSETALGEATFVESASTGKLKVTFVPSWLRFTKIGRGDYWILYTDYQYSLVGSPDYKYLWILSRSEVVDVDMILKLLKIAKQQGFKIKQLEFNYKLDSQISGYINNQ